MGNDYSLSGLGVKFGDGGGGWDGVQDDVTGVDDAIAQLQETADAESYASSDAHFYRNVDDFPTSSDAGGASLGDIFSNVGNSIGDTLAGIGDGLGGIISGGLDGVKSVLGSLGINTNNMGSGAINNLARSLIGNTGLSSAQLQNLLKSTNFRNASPSQQADALRYLQQQHALLSRTGASSGLASDGINYNSIFNSSGSAATGDGFGGDPSVGAFGGSNANASSEQALKDFMIQKGYPQDEMNAVFSSKDPTVRMTIRGQMIAMNEANQRTLLTMMQETRKNYDSMALDAARNIKVG